MGYPTFSQSTTWSDGLSVKRNVIKKITIVDKFDRPENFTCEWNAAASDSDPIMCYVVDAELIISGNGTGKIYTNKDASKMFGRISSGNNYFEQLTEIDGLDLLDTSKTTNMSTMFQMCWKVKELDLSNFNTSNVTNMQGMFSGATISNVDYFMELETIKGIENFDVSKVENLYFTFAKCANLTALDLSRWAVTNRCITLRQTFYQCERLTSIMGVGNWDTSGVVGINGEKGMNGTFAACSNLEELDLKNWDTSSATDMADMFMNMNHLQKLVLGSKFSLSGDGNIPQANRATIPTPSNAYIEGADGKWHTIHGNSFTSDALPSGINVTYYAIEAAAQEDLAKLKQTFVLVDGYTAVGIGDALREKAGAYGDLKPSEWAETIRSI